MRLARMGMLLKLTILGIGCCVFLGGSPARSFAANNADSCWSLEALAQRPGEKSIRRAPYDPAIEPRDGAASLAPLSKAKYYGSIRSVRLAHGEKLVALTFDLCENEGEISGYDGEIVDALRRLDAKVTFFASGKWLLDHPVRAQQLLADPRFQIGGHSWTHRNFQLLPAGEVKLDLSLDLKADALMRQSLRSKACYRPNPGQNQEIDHATLFRFPFGTLKIL